VQKDDFLRLAINGIHNDLVSRNEAYQSLALTFVANSKQQLLAAVLTISAHSTICCSPLMLNASRD
jgi:AP-2 complex subunit alpha